MKRKDLPKISVITPSYNQGHLIKETIDSVLNQNYPSLEYIVMDGGSTDNTVKVLRQYKNKLAYISKKDKGQTDAINKGIKKATGDILMYLNSDDVMLPNTLNIVAEYFNKHPKAMWLTGDYFIIDEGGKKIQSFVANYKKVLRKIPFFNTLSIANFIIQPSTFWRKELIKEIGAFDESLHLCMDYDYWMRIIRKYPLHVLPNHFSLFRIHGTSKGGTQYGKQFNEEHKVLCRYNDNLTIRFIHKIHATLIVIAYNIIK
jgi:glycosyltransferase involved in cell wall biosynthesis